jgi:iron(III) transport system permease protein
LATLPLAVFGSSRERQLTFDSLWFAANVALIAAPLGVFCAVLLSRTNAPGRRPVLFLFIALLLMPLYLQTAAWDAGFGRQGWYSVITGSMSQPPLAGWRGAVWVHAAAAIPWVTLIVAAGLSTVDPDVEDAALLDVAPLSVYLCVTLPLILDSIVIGTLWVVIAVMGEITVTDMYQVNTYARELYIGFALSEFLIEARPASTTTSFGAWPGIAITAWLTVAMFFCLRRLMRWTSVLSVRPPKVHDLHRASIPIAWIIGGAAILVGVVPIANLIYQAGIEVTQTSTTYLRQWSFVKFITILFESPIRFYREIGWTLVLGGVSASASVAIAGPLCWWGREGGWRAAPALLATVAGVAIPGPMIALAIIAMLNRESAPWSLWLYDQTIFAPSVALTMRSLPWSVLIIWFAFRTISGQTLENASLEGAGSMARLLWIAIPQRIPAIALAWLVAFTVAVGDLTSSILVMPPGVDSLSIRIFGLIHSGVDDHVAAICLLIIAGMFLVSAIAAYLGRRAKLWPYDAS